MDGNNAVPCVNACLRLGNLLIVQGEVVLILLGCLALGFCHGHGRTFQFGGLHCRRLLIESFEVGGRLLNLRQSDFNGIILTADSLNKTIPGRFLIHGFKTRLSFLVERNARECGLLSVFYTWDRFGRGFCV